MAGTAVVAALCFLLGGALGTDLSTDDDDAPLRGTSVWPSNATVTETELYISPRRRSFSGGFGGSPRRRFSGFSPPRRRIVSGFSSPRRRIVSGFSSPRRRSVVAIPRRRSIVYSPRRRGYYPPSYPGDRRRTYPGGYYPGGYHPGGYPGQGGYGYGNQGGGFMNKIFWLLLVCCCMPVICCFLCSSGSGSRASTVAPAQAPLLQASVPVPGGPLPNRAGGGAQNFGGFGGGGVPNYAGQALQNYAGGGGISNYAGGGANISDDCVFDQTGTVAIPKRVSVDFHRALQAEYMDGSLGAVGDYLEQSGVSDSVGQALEAEEENLRNARSRQEAQSILDELARRWQI